ncbi:MAG: chemotaxis protein CheX [Deltaproteobacteria bacterium]|nr:chemotaxis protein CheX [Deltaproteobacteria bacterium]
MKEMKETLMVAIFDVFERMFYVFLEPVNDEYSDYAMAATIQFGGALKGEVKIFVSERLAKSMVQNLLGIETEDITEKDIEDCIKEAVNMICGNFLGRLDQTKVFDLSIPSFSQRPGKAAQGENVCMLYFDSDSDGFGTTLTLFN